VVNQSSFGGPLDILPHPSPEKYPRQSILVIASDNYTYLVPLVDEENGYFLKTLGDRRSGPVQQLTGCG
jgi:hypothetical protein